MSPHHPHRYVIEVWSLRAADGGAWVRVAVVRHALLAITVLATATREFGYGSIRVRCLYVTTMGG